MLSNVVQHVLAGSQSAEREAMSGVDERDTDVVICAAVRTAVTKAKKGGLKNTSAEDMLAPLLHALAQRTTLDMKLVEDIQIGNVLMPGSGASIFRIGQLMGGIPYTTPLASVNRQCSSGLQAVANIAAGIKAGIIEIGIGGGVESMSNYDMQKMLNPELMSDGLFDIPDAVSCLTPMGITSENVALKYGVSRFTQDQLAAESHMKAIKAQKMGLFSEEIVPVRTKVVDPKGKMKEQLVDADDGPRPTTADMLAKLKPAFQKGGSTTAGNSSQVSDGAAAVLLARRSAATKYGLPILARIRSYAVVGVDPAYMGVGPAFAIPEALQKAGLEVKDVDIFEINEAFASQATMTVQHLNIPKDKVNPKGGAIALGHPLGCTGSRQIATLLPELKRTKGKIGVVSMCIGTGMGAAAVIENEQ